MLNNEVNEEIIPIIPTRECRICYEEVTEKIEFWLNGERKINERLNYKKKEGRWEKELLYP